MAEALDHAYRYPFASGFHPRRGLALAASGTDEAGHPYLEARAKSPRTVALLLRSVSDVVRSRHHIPSAMLEKILAESDPVFTVNHDVLRVEGFSSCCGLYARADLDASIWDGAELRPGSTNVDFNEPMRAALGRVRDGDEARLVVAEAGVDFAVVEAENEQVVQERRVRLPLRWIKSFLEVQIVQSRMEKRTEVPALAALRFLRSLPKTRRTSDAAHVLPTRGGLRLTTNGSSETIRLAGFGRLRVLEALLPKAKQLHVWSDPVTGASVWQVEQQSARFTLALSPDTWRAFSGEGQALDLLASPAEHVAEVRAQLKWQSELTPETIARAASLAPEVASRALAQLGIWGSVGFDLTRGAWFHRVLPVDLASARQRIEKQQPRLKAARKLVEGGCVQLTSNVDGALAGEIRSGDITHRSEVHADASRCTCPWFAKHGGDRGACKHVLALQLEAERRNP